MGKTHRHQARTDCPPHEADGAFRASLMGDEGMGWDGVGFYGFRPMEVLFARFRVRSWRSGLERQRRVHSGPRGALEGGASNQGFWAERKLKFAKRRMTVAEEKPEQLVRFDFPAGAAAEKKEKEPKKE